MAEVVVREEESVVNGGRRVFVGRDLANFEDAEEEEVTGMGRKIGGKEVGSGYGGAWMLKCERDH